MSPDQPGNRRIGEAVEMSLSMALLDAHADLLRIAAPPGTKDVPYQSELRIDANVRHAIARVCMTALRDLPVDERMEVMGMRSVDLTHAFADLPLDQLDVVWAEAR